MRIYFILFKMDFFIYLFYLFFLFIYLFYFIFFFLFLQYPDGLRKMKYNPNFAVRGLHYDVRKVCVVFVFFSQSKCVQVT